MKIAVGALLAVLAWAPTLGAQDAWLTRTPLRRTLAALTSPDASMRREAAERLAFMGPHASIADPLRVAIEHEPVPEVLTAMIASLARRAEASDLPALEAAWERVSAADRRAIVVALDAIGGEAALALLRAHLASEGASARACEALVRTEDRVRWLGTTLDDPAARDRVVSCLASADPSDTRDEALLRAGLDLEPGSARDLLRGLAGATTTSEAAVALAETALARGEAALVSPALVLLARHAPGRLTVERWQTWLAETDERAGSALRALLVLAPAIADEAIARARTGDAATAEHALAVLLDRREADDLPRIAAFVDVASTRTAALDALAERDGGDAVLAALPSAADVDLALALSRPSAASRAVLLSRSPSRIARALVADVDAGQCTATDASVRARREAALCLVLVGTSARDIAADLLETERDASVVAWLAIAARGASPSAQAIDALLDDPDARPAALSLIDTTLATALPTERRALEARLVHASSDPDEVTRAEAVRALGRLGRPVHHGAVLRALEDPSAQVRLAAAFALDGVGIARTTELRVIGRTHVETDARVVAALSGSSLAAAAAPIHVRVVEHDPSLAGSARVTVLLADGRALRVCPVDGEVLVPSAPDAPAIVRLGTAPGPGRH